MLELHSVLRIVVYTSGGACQLWRRGGPDEPPVGVAQHQALVLALLACVCGGQAHALGHTKSACWVGRGSVRLHGGCGQECL